jgi:type II secretory ATPase GspE/PulE/Tfp pilus assembly ATPase PilB-like protein
MLMTSAVRQVVLNGGNTDDIRKQAIADGMLTLRMDAVLKMKLGMVDYEEVIRETMS